MAFRLFTDGRTLAALSLYSEEPDAFTRDDLADGLAMAAHTGITVASTLELDQMRTALLSRRVIGEAIGILRERFTLTSDRAFSALRRLSSQQNLSSPTSPDSWLIPVNFRHHHDPNCPASPSSPGG